MPTLLILLSRRLSVIIVRNKYTQTIKQACTYIEQGHIRVGPHVITDPAFLVTRKMEDFITVCVIEYLVCPGPSLLTFSGPTRPRSRRRS